MKITFEGETIEDVIQDIEDMARLFKHARDPGPTVDAPKAMPDFIFEGPGSKPAPVDKPVEKFVSTPSRKRERTEKQKANDEKLRNRARDRASAKMAKVEPLLPKAPPPPPKTAEGMDPAEVVKLRQKTIEDLQSAYANGFQEQVFELLSRFGNGAKSFRELPPESFVPIREAIDLGALSS